MIPQYAMTSGMLERVSHKLLSVSTPHRKYILENVEDIRIEPGTLTFKMVDRVFCVPLDQIIEFTYSA